MNFFIAQGIIAKTKNSVKEQVGRTDLLLIQKQMHERLHVPYSDSCCDSPTDSVTGDEVAPVRWNLTEGILQFFNHTSGDWEDTTL